MSPGHRSPQRAHTDRLTFEKVQSRQRTSTISSERIDTTDVGQFDVTAVFSGALSKGDRNQELESVQLSQMEEERILSEQKSLHELLEKES